MGSLRSVAAGRGERSVIAVCLLGAAMLLGGCPAQPQEIEVSVGELRSLRGDLGSQRLRAEGAFEDRDAFLRLDGGARLLLEGASGAALGTDSFRLTGGRAFVETAGDETLAIETGEWSLRARDAAFSISEEEVYVARGEVAYRIGEQRGTIAAGQLFDGQESRGALLWNDWTGGLAEAGPRSRRRGGPGRLVARIPGAHGQARWPMVQRRLEVNVRIVGELAVTEVEQTFFNPASEAVEGIFEVRLPRAARIQRFAVDRNGSLVDGYAREKRQAAQAYAEQVYRGSTLDPALLEWQSPGHYRAKIYPIAPGASRRVSYRYAEWLLPEEDAPYRYRFPMADPDADGEAAAIQEVSVQLAIEGEADAFRGREGVEVHDGVAGQSATLVWRESDFLPRSDFVLEFQRPGQETATLWRGMPPAPLAAPGTPPSTEDSLDYLHVPLRLPEALFGARAEAIDVAVVVDVSAGTEGPQLELGRQAVEALLGHLGSEDRFAVLAADLALREGQALQAVTAEAVEGSLHALARQSAGGASDLGAAVTAAGELLDPSRPGIVVYVGDGAPTVGERSAMALLEHFARLPRPLRLYAVGVGREANLELLDAMVGQGGKGFSVRGSADAAETALALLEHARRPLLRNVEVELSGVERLFPRGPIALPAGELLSVVARVAPGEQPGSELVVRGEVGGEAFEHRVALREERTSDADLRVRWAGERLRRLLLSGAGREEIADLGVRYGLITPFTSFYVPSAAELSSIDGRHLYRESGVLAAFQEQSGTNLGALIQPTAAVFALPGCMMASSEPDQSAYAEEEAASVYEAHQERAQVAQAVQEAARAAEEAAARTQNLAPARPGDAPGDGTGAYDLSSSTTRTAAPAAAAPVLEELDDAEEGVAYARVPEAEPAFDTRAGLADSDNLQQGSIGFGGTGSGGGGLAGERSEGLAGLFGPTPGRRSASTSGRRRERRRPPRRASAMSASAMAATGAEQTLLGVLGTSTTERNDRLSGASLTISNRITIRYNAAQHRPRRCSDAAGQLLDTRISLWDERLRRASGPTEWIREYQRAGSRCELPQWRDRRAMLRRVLARAGSIPSMIQVYRLLSGAQAKRFVRHRTLRAVRTPEQLRLVRNAFGAAAASDDLVAQVLERATTPRRRVLALRRLIQQFPGDLELKLALLAGLDALGRHDEARRFAERLRADPASDAGVRTAIGDYFLRQGDEQEARRAFSEIVEFAPEDAVARRRLGDLYRAHGWHEAAYRQYETLAGIAPDDLSVLLLLAEAAAGTGRIDEALRLEKRLLETAEPGNAMGLARIALLRSSLRYAELRDEAEGDAKAELDARRRRSGVLRQKAAFRVALRWAHPDAEVSLWAAHPGSRLRRPEDLAPEFGVESFEVEAQEDGSYRFEVRRQGNSPGSAELVLLWNEGLEDEAVQVIALNFEGSAGQSGAAARRAEVRSFEVQGRTVSDRGDRSFEGARR